jgi:hypothetical protein
MNSEPSPPLSLRLGRPVSPDLEILILRQAARITANLLAKCPDDGPALLLGYRALSYRVHEPAPADLVWELPGK